MRARDKPKRPAGSENLRVFSIICVFIAAANVVVLALIHSYDVTLGPLHLAAHGLFKPLLYSSAALLLAILASGGSRPPHEPGNGWRPNALFISLVTVAVYAPSIFVNPLHHDWTHRHISAGIQSLADAARLFSTPQADGFYRPLPFLSLWLDYTIFHTHYWGYHLQSIARHIANALLIIRLGERIGLSRTSASFASLLFATAAVNFEPVLWPAARFDLMATLFTILAMLAALRYVSQPARWHPSLGWMLAAFAAGLLSKESAFCFPLLLILLLAGASLTPLRWIILLASAGFVAVLAVAARIVVYGNFGGYPEAPHFVFQTNTVTSFFTRALPVPLFALDTSVPLRSWMVIAVIGFAVASCGLALASRGWLRRDASLLVAALLSAVPAANLVNWISASMQNTRYLYMPSIWIFLLLAAAGSNLRARRWLVILAIANCLGVAHNVITYRRLIPPETAGATPTSDCRSCPAP